jgi:hypothetical protein
MTPATWTSLGFGGNSRVSFTGITHLQSYSRVTCLSSFSAILGTLLQHNFKLVEKLQEKNKDFSMVAHTDDPCPRDA